MEGDTRRGLQIITPRTRWFAQGRLYEILYKGKDKDGEFIIVQDYQGNTPYRRALPLKSWECDIVEVEACEHEQRVYVPPIKRKMRKGEKIIEHLG